MRVLDVLILWLVSNLPKKNILRNCSNVISLAVFGQVNFFQLFYIHLYFFYILMQLNSEKPLGRIQLSIILYYIILYYIILYYIILYYIILYYIILYYIIF